MKRIGNTPLFRTRVACSPYFASGGAPDQPAGVLLPLTHRPWELRSAREGGVLRKPLLSMQIFSAPDRIRTCDLRFRRPTLYPTELRARAGPGPRTVDSRGPAASYSSPSERCATIAQGSIRVEATSPATT